MSEQRQLITETADRVFSDHCDKSVVDGAEAGSFPTSLWHALSDTGLSLAGVSEQAGGSGGDFSDALTVLRVAGRHVAPIPLAETFMAAMLIEQAGGTVPSGVFSVAQGEFRLGDRGVSGSARSVAFARDADYLLVTAQSGTESVLCLLPKSIIAVEKQDNMAGEARDTVQVSGEPVVTLPGNDATDERFRQLGALTRTVLMTGALESTLDLAVSYALERNQFGRAIAKFQAIQHQLAVLAGHVAASIRATESVMVPSPTLLDIAIAKARVGESVGQCTEIAHQVHGAMGYTREHQLNHRTRRLWCWREEYGNERYWQQWIGQKFLTAGGSEAWPLIAAT